MVEIYLNLPSKKIKTYNPVCIAWEKAECEASYSSLSPASFSFPDFPSAAAAAPEPDPLRLPFHRSLLSLFTTFPDLLSSLEYRAGKVQAC